MKKVIALVTALLMMGTCVVASAELYADTFVVCEVDYDTDTVWLMDFNGFLYSFEGCEDWAVGDLCSVLMDDDTIISCRYSGWVSGEWGWTGDSPLCVF